MNAARAPKPVGHTLWCASWLGRPCDCWEPTTADLLDRIDADLGDPEETP